MIKGCVKVKLSAELILSKITSYDIFRCYMPGNWEINKKTISPFRQEKNASFIIKSGDNNSLYFMDFADVDKKGNCFDFVKMLYHFSMFDEVLSRIANDFGLINDKKLVENPQIVQNYKQPLIIPKEKTVIQVKTRRFTNEELAYWNMFYQDVTDLKAANIHSIDNLYLNRQKIHLKPTELRFGYFYKGFWKIYTPFGDKLYKWSPNNVPITTMEGLENIKECKIGFINKSKKDYMVVKKVFEHSCAVQNEGSGCFSDQNVEYLKTNCKTQILSFDSDATGVANSQKITKKFDFDYCNVPKMYLAEDINDWAGLASKYGLKKVEQIIKNKINEIP